MLPEIFHDLAWDVSPADVDPIKNSRWMITRVLTCGSLTQVYELERLVGREAIREFFQRDGLDLVDSKTASLWLTLLELSKEQCTRKSSHASS